MSIAECHYKNCGFFSSFSPASCSIYFQVLHHPSSIWDGLHLMEQALSPIKYCLVTPTSFVSLLHWCALQAGHHVDGKARSWVGVHLSPLVEC